MNPTTSGRYMRTLKTLHTVLLAGMMLFAAIAVILLGTKTFTGPEPGKMHDILKFLAPLAALSGFIGSTIIFKKQLDEINAALNSSLGQKLARYRTACIIRWALLEGPVILAVIGLLLTGNYYFYGPIIFLLLIFFLLYAPSEEKIKMQVKMSSAEQAVLDDNFGEIE
jgi:hypothetical protein